MGMGYLTVHVFCAEHALPVINATVAMRDYNGSTLYTLTTDKQGKTDSVPLPAPDASHTLHPDDPGPHYSTGVVEVSAGNYNTVKVYGVQIFDGQTTILPVEMPPMTYGGAPLEINIPPHRLDSRNTCNRADTAENTPPLGEVTIPANITVHLSAPAMQAPNISVRFADYIKNVACGELYPTWPATALRAGILKQISFALNRIHTEWYPNRGYPFHITASPHYDMAYTAGRNLFASITHMVDEIFHTYPIKWGFATPHPSELYANIQPVMAQAPGREPPTPQPVAAQPAILQAPEQEPPATQPVAVIPAIRQAPEPEPPTPQPVAVIPAIPQAPEQQAPIAQPDAVNPPFPGTLREGSSGEPVRLLQRYLNEIARACPFSGALHEDGRFGPSTKRMVQAFQRMAGLKQDGQIDQAVWNTIVRTRDAVA